MCLKCSRHWFRFIFMVGVSRLFSIENGSLCRCISFTLKLVKIVYISHFEKRSSRVFRKKQINCTNILMIRFEALTCSNRFKPSRTPTESMSSNTVFLNDCFGNKKKEQFTSAGQSSAIADHAVKNELSTVSNKDSFT